MKIKKNFGEDALGQKFGQNDDQTLVDVDRTLRAHLRDVDIEEARQLLGRVKKMKNRKDNYSIGNIEDPSTDVGGPSFSQQFYESGIANLQETT